LVGSGHGRDVATAPTVGAPPLVEGTPVSAVAPAFFGDGVRDAHVACDRPTLEAMYAELAPRVHRFLRDLLGDPALASDAAQETFVRAFRRIDELPEGARLRAWVFGIARRVSLEMRRARGRRRRVIVEAEGATNADVADGVRGTPENELLDREAVQVVERAFERLSDERRAVLLLRLDHELSYDEIAQTMGWSLAKVKVEIFRARGVLRATLDEYRRR
jgi:RNA polymerase sigma-70 factor (ECF subfamily)